MNLNRDATGITEAQAMLDRLPELYFAVLKSAQIEQQADIGVRFSFELPILGKRTMTAATAREAIRAILEELCDILTKTPIKDWPESWRNLASSVPLVGTPSKDVDKNERFQSKARQFTIGVTMPANLKQSLQEISDKQQSSFAKVVRQLASLGFEDFDERTFSEGSEELLSAFSVEVNKWQPSKTEQVMVRLDPQLAIRLRSTAKEYQRSASEFGAMCLAHGFVLQNLLIEIEQKVATVRGAAIRKLAPKVGLEAHAALLSSVLAGSVSAPRKVLKDLGEVFETPEFALNAFFKHSFAARGVPAFKAENGKPEVYHSQTSWEKAVKSLNLPLTKTKELLQLDE